MVKSLLAILGAVLILAGAVVLEWLSVGGEFESFGEALNTLYEKTDEGTATAEDAKAVQQKWETGKDRLYVWIPHNDITRIDDYMSETVRLIGEKQRALALSKLEILIHLTECLPDTYKPGIQNVF